MIVRLSNSRKTRYSVNLSSTNFWGKFHYIFLPCLTFILYIKKATLEKNLLSLHFTIRLMIGSISWVMCMWVQIHWSFLMTAQLSGMHRREQVNYWIWHSVQDKGISIWVLTQQVTSIVNAIRENIASFVLFHTPLANNMKIIFKTYAGQLASD